MIDEMLDDSLCSVMKGKCTDVTQGRKASQHQKAKSETHVAVDAKWEPVGRMQSDLDRVKLVVLSLIPYVVLIAVVFWWQQSERLESTTGFWALIILALMAGISIGRSVQKEE